MMLALLERSLEDIRATVRGLEPEKLACGDAAVLFDVFSALERAAVAGKTLLAPRASDSGVWKTKGHRSPAAWVAEVTGSGLGEAIGMLETAQRLQALPETTEAFRRGELSAPQVREIATTAAGNPSTEGELLAAAGRNGLKGLKDHCRRVRARSAGEAAARARYEEIRKSRFLRTWTDPDGAGRVEARLAPDDMGRFMSAIRCEANAVFGEARKAGLREPMVAYEADALVALVTGTGTGTGRDEGGGRRRGKPTTTMHLRVDLAALRRGSLEGEEICEIPGVGPVPVARAVAELGDAVLKVMISDGVDVTTVCHLGRTVPAHVRSALEERDEKCVVPGCDVARGLEIDHYKVAFEKDGPTELWKVTS